MNTPSPFAEVQRMQEQQREGWVEDKKPSLTSIQAEIREAQFSKVATRLNTAGGREAAG